MTWINGVKRYLAWPESSEIRRPEIEDLFQSGSNEDGVDTATEESPRHDIEDFIRHLNASRDGAEAMLVIPKAKRSNSLFIHKTIQGFNMLDFGDPGHRYPGNCSNAIRDNQS